MTPDPQNPTDDAPSVVEAGLETAEGQFTGTEDGAIRCLTCGAVAPARSAQTGEAARVEGASDPDDMLLIVSVRCPSCAATGSLSLGYGPRATLEDAEVVRRL